VRIDSSIDQRLLDATLDVAAVHGLRHLSVGDVAKQAGLSRQTLYKHFANKEELISRAVLREAGRIVESVLAAARQQDSPFGKLEAAIYETLRQVRNHPLLDRLIATEPEALLPLLIEEQGAVLDAVRVVAKDTIGGLFPEVADADVQAGADLLSRMLLSYAVRPPDDPPETVTPFLARAVIACLFSSAVTFTGVGVSLTPDQVR
jgi:AcrR family transcriptional regulator